MLVLISGCVLCLLAWRLWRFTIRPALHPDEPKEVPYWIPFVGTLPSQKYLAAIDHYHSQHPGPILSFYRDFDKAITNSIAHFNSRSPFRVTLFGSPLYIISDPIDVAEISRHSKTFTLEPLAKDLLLKFGISKGSTERLFLPVPNANANANANASPSSKAPRAAPLHGTDAIIDLYRQNISPGEKLDAFVEGDILPRFTAILSPTALGLDEKEPNPKTLSLQTLCIQAFIDGIVRAYYGDIMTQLQPKFTAQYMTWEKTNWKFLMGWPGFLSRDMQSARGDIIGFFVEYFRIPVDERGHRNGWVESVEELVRGLNLEDEEIGKMFMLHTMSIVGNMYKLAFWLLAHLLSNPSLLDAITTEIKPAFKDSQSQTPSINHTHLTDPEKCPLLDSLYSEVLRLIVTSPMTRQVSSEATVSGKTLQPGNKVLIIYRQLHLDRETWGLSPEIMQPDRFIRDKTLKNKPAYRPWGAGKHVCPGRFLAKKAVFGFVALLLGQYEVGTEEGEGEGEGFRFPRADLARASGVASIAEGEDVILRLRLRKREE